MPKLVVLVGPCGSGKSTYAKELQSEGYFRVNQDEQGKTEHSILFLQALTMDRDIVVDRMNFNKEQRKKYLVIAKNEGYTTEIIVFHESQETCLQRCVERKDHPTIKDEETAKKVLHFFFSRYERPTNDEADLIISKYPEGHKPSAIICDLDGTLCNIDHRLKWMKTEKKHWPQFFLGIKDDSVNNWCAHILGMMYQSQGMNIVLCSGRGNEYRKPTETWLDKHGIKYHNLFMREAGDFRKDDAVKEIILDFEILTRYTPYFAIDDRKQVYEMWRRRGITTLACAEGNF